MAYTKSRNKGDEPVKSSSERYSDYVEGFSNSLAEMIANNTAPWQKPWEPGEGTGGLPYNATTGKAYSGSNAIYLVMQQMQKGYSDDRWLTFKQAQDLGANVRRGEKGTQLVKWIEREQNGKAGERADQGVEGEAEKQKRLFPVLFTVFNAEQCDNLAAAPAREIKSEHERHELCEQLLKDSGVQIQHNGGNRAYYRPMTDSIHLPERTQFKSADGYYATALHECAHATGHPSRLNRDLTGAFGSESYAREELRAEIASFMMGTRLQVGHDPSQHAAYLQSWVKIVREDPKAILKACQDAEKICEHLGVAKYEHAATQKAELTAEQLAEKKAEATRTRRHDQEAPMAVPSPNGRPRATAEKTRAREAESGMGMVM